MEILRYIIILEEVVKDISFVLNKNWEKIEEIDLPSGSSWDKVYLWQHTSTLIVELKVRERIAPIKVRRMGESQVVSGRTQIQINTSKTDRPDASEEVSRVYRLLMNFTHRTRSMTFFDWDEVIDQGVAGGHTRLPA